MNSSNNERVEIPKRTTSGSWTQESPVAKGTSQLTLAASTAADLMTSYPVSIRSDDVVSKAMTLLSGGFNAIPVIDEKKKPVGFLSQGDLFLVMCQRFGFPPFSNHANEGSGLLSINTWGADSWSDIQAFAAMHVWEVMHSEVNSVSMRTAAITVVTKMLLLKTHRLFVVNDAGEMVGIITSIDVMFALHP